jgi:hypothetical protein
VFFIMLSKLCKTIPTVSADQKIVVLSSWLDDVIMIPLYTGIINKRLFHLT